MKRYSVEIRTDYEVEADSAEDALARALGAGQREGVRTEYLVRQRHEATASRMPQRDDPEGLDKPVYTVAEVASMLGSSRSSVYELVRRGVKNIRMGRRVLIPRGSVAAILNGEVQLNERVAPPPPPQRRRQQRIRERERAEIAPPARERAKPEPKPKISLSITEAARMLRMPTSRLRELMAQRKIYYVDNYGKQRIPPQAIENFVNGLPAIAFLEENIAAWKAAGKWDNDLEEAAAKMLSDWKTEDA